MKIAGCVVVYGEDLAVLKNIKSYEDELEKIYIFDNNEHSDLQTHLPKTSKIEYISKNQNKGIAYALNYCATCAIKDGYEWLLTMDQDSKFKTSIKPMINLAKNSNSKVGLIIPNHNIGDFYKEASNLVAMTSGNLLNLKIYQKLEGFKEYFFIDLVDYEYCLNLRKNNYEMIYCNEVILDHHLGKINSKKLFKKTIYYTNHNAIRRYYITRNRLILNHLYEDLFPEFCHQELRYNKRELIKVLLFEDEKIKKLKNYLKAKQDYKKWRTNYEKTKND